MIIPAKYQEHTELIKSTMNPHRSSEQKEDFLKIIQGTKDLSYGDSKDYLESLSKNELKTIQNYHNLADSIDVNSLTEEGATNLLVEQHQKLDYNGDGRVEVGIARTGTFLPQDMAMGLKKAIVNALKDVPKESMPNLMLTLHTAVNRHEMYRMAAEKGEYVDKSKLEPNYTTDAIKFLKELNENGQAFTAQSKKASKDIIAFANRVLSEYQDEGQEKSIGSQFVDEVRAAGGMLNYVQKLNQEKIQKLIEEKRIELESKYKVNEPGISKEERAKRVEQVNDALESFIKELMKKLETESNKKIFSSNPLEEILKKVS